jgi:hypothetical protein
MQTFRLSNEDLTTKLTIVVNKTCLVANFANVQGFFIAPKDFFKQQLMRLAQK